MVPNWLTCLCHCICIFIFFIYSLCPYWMFLDTEMKPVLCRKALHGLAAVKYWITHNKLQIFWHLSSPMGFRQSAEFDPYAILMLAHTSFIILHWAGYEQQHFNRDISSIRCVVVLYLTQMHTDSINNCNCQITWTWSDQMRQLKSSNFSCDLCWMVLCISHQLADWIYCAVICSAINWCCALSFFFYVTGLW